MVIGSSTVKAHMDVKVTYYIHYKLDTMTSQIELVTKFQVDPLTHYTHTYRLEVTDEVIIKGQFDLQTFVYGKWIAELKKTVDQYVDDPYTREHIILRATSDFSKFSGKAVYTKDGPWGNVGYNSGGYFKHDDDEFNKKLYAAFNKPVEYSPNRELSRASRQLPGIGSPADYPCECPLANVRGPVRDIIMHLNDKERWTREKIADWLDDLQDNHGYNFDFQPWAEEEELV